MTTREYLSCAETAKLLRKALKAAFPAVKFSVRSSVYSMGASIDVSYTDGPSAEAVNDVAEFFAGATFDGMQDLKTHHERVYEGRTVQFGADYVFVHQSVSDARRVATEAALLTLDDRQMNELEAAMSMGRFGRYADRRPMCPEHFDWSLFVRNVALATVNA